MKGGLQRLVGDGRQACLSLGRVAKHDGDAQHWSVNDDGDLEVSVVLDTHEVPVVALVAANGHWRIPAEGEEVLVAHADGDFEGDAVIVAILEDVPAGLVPGRTLVVGSEVRLGNSLIAALVPLLNGVVLASGVDPFTGATYGALGSASSKVLAEK